MYRMESVASERLVLMSTIIPIYIDRPFPHIEDDDVYEDEDED